MLLGLQVLFDSLVSLSPTEQQLDGTLVRAIRSDLVGPGFYLFLEAGLAALFIPCADAEDDQFGVFVGLLSLHFVLGFVEKSVSVPENTFDRLHTFCHIHQC